MRASAIVLLLLSLVWNDLPVWAAANEVTVTDLELVSTRRVGRTVNEYVFRAELENTGVALTGVIGTATSNTPATTIVEGQLLVGDLATGSVTPLDTVTIRHNRRYRFSPTNLTIAFTGDEVAGGDNAPEIQSSPVSSGNVGEAYVYNVVATDADSGDLLTYALQLAPDDMSIDGQIGAINWVPGQAGQFDVDIVVTDSTGLSDRQIYLLGVGAGTTDQPPAIAPIANQTVVVGDTLTVSTIGSDPEGGTIRFGIVESPPGLGINSATGAVAWTPTAAQAGVATVTLSVSDPGGQTASTSFSIAVLAERANSPPMISAVADQIVNVGSTLNFTLSASDPDENDVLTLDLTGAPNGLVFDAASGRLTWTPAAADMGDAFLSAKVTDSSGASSSTSFTVTVVGTPVSPKAQDDTYTLGARSVLNVPAPGVLDNDVDGNNDALTAASTSQPSLGTLDAFSADGSFQYRPPPIPPIAIGFNTQCETLPITAQSDNRSIPVADVDADGDIEFLTLSAGLYPGGVAAELRVFNGATCQLESLAVLQPINGNNIHLATNDDPITLVNLDNDPELEVVAAYGVSDLFFPNAHFVAMNLDGTPVWGGSGLSETLSDPNINTRDFADISPSAVDLDGDGKVELVAAFYNDDGPSRGLYVVAYNGEDGTVRWEAIGRTVSNGPPRPRAWTIADIDLDGTVEILFGNTVFSHDGQIEFNFPNEISSFMEVAVANFDSDPFAEILSVDRSGHRLFEHTGALKWYVPRALGHHGGITIAQLDGDPTPEYLVQQNVAGQNRHLAAFDGDGSPLWSHQGTEFELDVFHVARTTTPIAFDLDRDGIDELVTQINVTADGRSDQGTHIFDGSNGTSIANVVVESSLLNGENGLVTVADVDGDGAAEILQVNNVGICCNAIRVLEGQAGNPFPAARAIRNQWLYHPTQVAEDGSIPRSIQPQWLIPGLNKQNVSAVIPGERPTRNDEFQYVANDGDADSNIANVRIEIATVNAPTIVSQPPLGASPGFLYEYPGLATDADFGDTLVWTLADSPAGMSVDGFGIVQWTPDPADLGVVRVNVVVTDSDGHADSQVFEINVAPPSLAPDVVGDTQDDATSAIAAAGLVVGRLVQNYSLSVPAGRVISQSTAGGQALGAGASIDVVISLGPPPIFAPTLVSLNQSTAQAELAALGLSAGGIAFVNSEEVPSGLVVSQSVAPGDLLSLGDRVDLTVSSGSALRVGADARIVGAGTAVTLSIEVFDVNGVAVPLPPFTVGVTPAAGASGTVPMVSDVQVNTAADTLGAYAIEVDVPGFGVRQLDIVVRAELDAGSYLSPIADFAVVIDTVSDIYGAIDTALVAGDLVTVQQLAQQLVSIRAGLDLQALASRNPFAPDSGFLPSVAEASTGGFAPGITPLATGTTLLNQLSAAIVDVQSYLALLDPSRGRNDDLRARVVNDSLNVRVDQLLAQDLPVGTQLALNGATFNLLAIQVPETFMADLNLSLDLLADNGLVSLETPSTTLIASGDIGSLYDESRPVFFSLGGMMSAISIRSRLWKKLYLPSITRLVSSGLVLAQAGLLKQQKAPVELSAIITGASQSFHVFGLNGSIIEGVDFSPAGRAFKISVIGPDLYQGVVNTIVNASVPKSMSDALKLGNNVANAASQGNGAGNKNGKVNAVLSGCFFDQNPACAQLVLGAGFPVVHTQGAFPAPVLIVVEDLISGQLYSGVYPFFPMPL